MQEHDKRFFGFKINEIVIIATLLLSVTAFYWRTNDAIDRLVKITNYLADFATNSDTYNSARTGVQFLQGKPVNPNYQVRRDFST